jgi:hypothetical protein
MFREESKFIKLGDLVGGGGICGRLENIFFHDLDFSGFCSLKIVSKDGN